MTTPETLFSPGRRALLAQAVPERVSCRAFSGPLQVADWSALSYLTGRYALGGARLALMRTDDSLFTGTLLGPGRITGCAAAAAVIIDMMTPHARINAGMIGEAFVLEAHRQGIASCWVTGTYQKKRVDVPLRPGEMVLGVIALGRAALSDDPARRRKMLDRICRGDFTHWPAPFLHAAELVRLAPSAMNLQPWGLSVEDGALCLDGTDRSQTDLGIALCHAELALDVPHAWIYGESRREPMLRAVLR